MTDLYLTEQNYITSISKKIPHIDCSLSGWKKNLDDISRQPELEIQWATQGDFEYIIDKVKDHILLLKVWSPKISDLNPLELLAKVEYLIIDWNQKSTGLWNLGRNAALKELALSSFRRLTDLSGLKTAPHLKGLYLGGDLEKKWRIASLEPLSALTSLEALHFWEIRLDDGSFRPLHNLKQLKRLRAELKICNTEEYARLFAALRHTECDYSSGIFPMEDLNTIELIGKGKRCVTVETGWPKAEEFSRQFQKSVEEYMKQENR
ncbi:hypothetical protein C4J81_05185 [Deltaproteobacteria bacterium Smac51]|nr:hypothetical protein C4J81_05185 [Deltaproteobacteria bacterium Smac51]